MILSSFNKTSISAKYLGSVLFIIMITLIYYFIKIKPGFAIYNQLVAMENNLREDFELKYHRSNLLAYQKQLCQLKKIENSDIENLLTDSDMAVILKQIAKAGAEAGLIFDLFSPQPEKIHDFYLEKPIEIVVLGNYHQLGLFLSSISELKPMVSVHQFELSRIIMNGKNKADSKLLRMQLLAKIYQINHVK